MNCSLAIALLPDLLIFLSNYKIPGWIIHADAECVSRVRKIVGSGLFYGTGLEQRTGLDSRLAHVFFSKGENVSDEIQNGPERVVVVENEKQFVKIAVFDARLRKWVLSGWTPKPSLLTYSMSNVTVSIALFTIAGATPMEAVNGFINSIGALYWDILVSHYKFRILYLLVSRPVGDQSFNSVRQTMETFSRSNADTISDLLLISAERVEKFNFIIIGLEVKYHFIIRRPEYEYSALAVVRPLAPSVWFGVLAMIPGVGFGLWFIFRCAPGSVYRPNFLSSVFLAFGICCTQIKLSGLSSGYVRVAFICSLYFFFQIQQFYVSNLYSMLATREINYPFNTIEEFIDRRTHKLAISPDTSVYTAFRTAENSVFQRVWKGFMENDPGHVINDTNMPQVMERVCQGNTAIFALPLQIQSYSSDECPLMAVPVGYFPNDMAIATKKDFAYIPQFQALFLRTMESGVSHYLKKKFIMSIMPDMKKTDLSVDPVPVSLQQVFFIFAILAVSAVLSIIFLLLENLYYKKTYKYQTHEPTFKRRSRFH